MRPAENRKIAICIAVLGAMILLGAGVSARAGDLLPPNGPDPEADTGPVAVVLKLFGKTVSKVDGHRCAMYPTCSAYSAQAFHKHGFVKGWVMTADRLLRCGRDETRLSETILIDRRPHVYDPLQRNDFWWSAP